MIEASNDSLVERLVVNRLGIVSGVGEWGSRRMSTIVCT